MFYAFLVLFEGYAEGLFDDVGGEDHVRGDLGDLPADEGAAFPDLGIGTCPIDFCQGSEFLFPVLGMGEKQGVARFADGL